jgi:hypothetical protein
MKITIDMDTTPLELRQFLGFPDVQPMQKAVMTELEKNDGAVGAFFAWGLDARVVSRHAAECRLGSRNDRKGFHEGKRRRIAGTI